MSVMAASGIHPAAPHYLPSFLVEAGQSDILMIVTAFILLASVVGFGLLFLRIHTLPERMAHRTHKIQFEIVAVLGLLALFTHQHAFWVAGLLLAFIEIPDFLSPLRRIATSSEKMAGIEAPPDYDDEHDPDHHGEPAKPARGKGK
jgi:hypothetical protein